MQTENPRCDAELSYALDTEYSERSFNIQRRAGDAGRWASPGEVSDSPIGKTEYKLAVEQLFNLSRTAIPGR